MAATNKSAELRREFVHDFVAVCAEVDFPLVKNSKAFVLKYCKKEVALPERVGRSHQIHLSWVFDQQMFALLQKNCGKKFSVVEDKTTDAREFKILNIEMQSLYALFWLF